MNSYTLILFFFSVAKGLRWDGAVSTSVASPTMLVSIIPTPTAQPLFELAKRDAWPVSYCGFAGANLSQGIQCSSHSSCVWNTDFFVVGCCATSTRDCLFYTSCIDESSPATAADDSLVYTCRGTKTCFANNYPSNYRQWGCGHNATSVALTYSNMVPGAATIQQVFTGTADELVTTTMTVTAVPIKGSTSSSNIPTTTVIAAVLGGLALLIIGALLITVISLRHHRKHNPKLLASPSFVPKEPPSPASSLNPIISYSANNFPIVESPRPLFSRYSPHSPGIYNHDIHDSTSPPRADIAQTGMVTYVSTYHSASSQSPTSHAAPGYRPYQNFDEMETSRHFVARSPTPKEMDAVGTEVRPDDERDVHRPFSWKGGEEISSPGLGSGREKE